MSDRGGAEVTDIHYWNWQQWTDAVVARKARDAAAGTAGPCDYLWVVRIGMTVSPMGGEATPDWVEQRVAEGWTDQIAVLYRRDTVVGMLFASPSYVPGWGTERINGDVDVRRIAGVFKSGIPQLDRIIGHLIARAAGDLLDPPEPEVDLHLVA